MAERAGFDIVWASSFAVSATRALPDLSLLTMTDQLQAAAQMAGSCSIPVLADCDTGFGGPLNAAYTVQMYEIAGIGGICLEDQAFPKANSFIEDRQTLASPEEFAHKIECAKRAQRSTDFVLVARTEALICGESLDSALRRAHGYVDAGADAILVHSKSSTPDEIEAFLASWNQRAPAIVIPTTYYTWTVERASRAGASLIIYANHALRAAVRSMASVMRDIYESGTTSDLEKDLASVKEILELTCLKSWVEFES
jgi:phosphoenolpyruvate phosphomutase